MQGEKGRADSLPHREEVFQPRQSSGHLVFLSARPESYKGFTEGLSFKRIFEPLVRRGELQGQLISQQKYWRQACGIFYPKSFAV